MLVLGLHLRTELAVKAVAGAGMAGIVCPNPVDSLKSKRDWNTAWREGPNQKTIGWSTHRTQVFYLNGFGVWHTRPRSLDTQMFTCLLSPIPGHNHVNYGPGVLQLTEKLVFQFFGVSVFLGSTYLLRRYLEPLWYYISFWTLTNRPCLSTPTWRPRVVKDIWAAWLKATHQMTRPFKLPVSCCGFRFAC